MHLSDSNLNDVCIQRSTLYFLSTFSSKIKTHMQKICFRNKQSFCYIWKLLRSSFSLIFNVKNHEIVDRGSSETTEDLFTKLFESS